MVLHEKGRRILGIFLVAALGFVVILSSSRDTSRTTKVPPSNNFSPSRSREWRGLAPTENQMENFETVGGFTSIDQKRKMRQVDRARREEGEQISGVHSTTLNREGSYVKPLIYISHVDNGTTTQNDPVLFPGGYRLSSEYCLPQRNQQLSPSSGGPAVVYRWSDLVVGVLTDPPNFHHRLIPAFHSWLDVRAAEEKGNEISDAYPAHIFLFFTKSDASIVTCQETLERFLEANITCVLLDPPTEPAALHPPGAWKNLEILRFWEAMMQVWRKFSTSPTDDIKAGGNSSSPNGEFSQLLCRAWMGLPSAGKSGGAAPVLMTKWQLENAHLTKQYYSLFSQVIETNSKLFLTADDDTFLLRKSTLEKVIRAIHDATTTPSSSVMSSSSSERPLYLGHQVMHCAKCRDQRKRFPFAFGGSGFFLDAVSISKIVQNYEEQCRRRTPPLPGDERVGLCAKLLDIPLIDLSGAAESPFSSFGENAESIFSSKTKVEHSSSPSVGNYPWSFHRITKPVWFDVLKQVEEKFCPVNGNEAQLGGCCWGNIAKFLLDRVEGNETFYRLITDAAAASGSGLTVLEDVPRLSPTYFSTGEDEVQPTQDRRKGELSVSGASIPASRGFPLINFYPTHLDPQLAAYRQYLETKDKRSKGKRRRG